MGRLLVPQVKHTINGKFFGMWYETDSGHKLYLAHRTKDQIQRSRNAWCLDVSLLEKCRANGVWAVGVIRREGKNRWVWLTHVDDFFDCPDSFPHFHKARQRGLPLSCFRLDPSRSAKYIELAVKIR